MGTNRRKKNSAFVRHDSSYLEKWWPVKRRIERTRNEEPEWLSLCFDRECFQWEGELSFQAEIYVPQIFSTNPHNFLNTWSIIELYHSSFFFFSGFLYFLSFQQLPEKELAHITICLLIKYNELCIRGCLARCMSLNRRIQSLREYS